MIIIEYGGGIFYNVIVAIYIKIAVYAALFICGAVGVFSQDAYTPGDAAQQRSIPQELLRPRREEAPRYPVDTVIGPLGQSKASTEAYEFARSIAAALLAGTMDVPVLASVNPIFLESCMNSLQVVNPRFFRIGSGREEPDGAVSFLVRFIGREQGITGELYVRFQARRLPPPPPVIEEEEPEAENEFDAEEDLTAEEQTPPEQTPAVNIPIEMIWVFEDLILEEPRSREEENRETRQRFDFPPYERFF